MIEDTKLYKCPICKEWFNTTKSIIDQHILKHKWEYSIVCCPYIPLLYVKPEDKDKYSIYNRLIGKYLKIKFKSSPINIIEITEDINGKTKQD